MATNRPLRCLALLLLPGLPAGCSLNYSTNPALPLGPVRAADLYDRMCETPKPLARPLVVTGGIGDPGLGTSGVVRYMRRVTPEDDAIISVNFFGPGSGTFEACRDGLIEAVEAALPSDDPELTVEVDVIGISMGGLVARYAACCPGDSGKRLQIRRLFTISTPHRGARLAALPTIDPRKLDMRAGSDFLVRLDEELPDAGYELLPYARLDDLIVGTENAAPPGQTAWWVYTPPLTFGHLGASQDPRILADIARRLRGETPLTTEPGPPPERAATNGKPPRRIEQGSPS